MDQSTMGSGKYKKSLGIFIQDIVNSSRKSVVVAISSSVATFLVSGALWIAATGGTFYQLPAKVEALEHSVFEGSAQYQLIIESQDKINEQQKELNLLQSENNKKTSETLSEIKTELRSINEFLREQYR